MSESMGPPCWHKFEVGRRAVSDFVLETISVLTEERDWYRAAWQEEEREKAHFQDARDKLIVQLCERKDEISQLKLRIGILQAHIETLKTRTALQEADHGDEKPATKPATGGG